MFDYLGDTGVRAEVLHSTWDKRFVSAIREHYSGSAGPPPGKKLAWRLDDGTGTIGWIGIGEPSYKLAPRRRLGLLDARPLDHTVSLFIWRRVKTDELIRSSELLRPWHAQAELDWEARYGWRPVHWETMVLPSAVKSRVPGACFRRSGYRSIGMTTGRGARRPPGHTRGPRVWGNTEPKLVLYRGPLCRVAPGMAT